MKRIDELFDEEHRKALALELVMHPDEDLANEEIFDLLDQKSAAPPPGYKSWNDFHRKGGRSPHDMVTKVKRTLREKGLLGTIQ